MIHRTHDQARREGGAWGEGRRKQGFGFTIFVLKNMRFFVFGCETSTFGVANFIKKNKKKMYQATLKVLQRCFHI